MGGQDHWEKVYRDRDVAALTWHEASPGRAFEVLRDLARRIGPGAVIDVGGGASALAGALLDAGFGPITVLDLSRQALDRAADRLGPEKAARINWQVADVTAWQPGRLYDFWHDRAVFHFLTAESDRRAYARTLMAALRPGGHAVMSTFADDGPERCSGLPVRRYAPRALATEMARLTGDALQPVHAERLDHVTPAGNIQKFQLSVLRRAD